MKRSYGFDVSLNGTKIARAGIEKENYVVNCIISAVSRKDASSELSLYVGGLDSESENHVTWQGADLKVGDKIVVEVVDKDFDAPAHTGIVYSEEELRERKLKYFYELREELKDYI